MTVTRAVTVPLLCVLVYVGQRTWTRTARMLGERTKTGQSTRADREWLSATVIWVRKEALSPSTSDALSLPHSSTFSFHWSSIGLVVLFYFLRSTDFCAFTRAGVILQVTVSGCSCPTWTAPKHRVRKYITCLYEYGTHILCFSSSSALLIHNSLSFTPGLKPACFTNPAPVVSLLPPGLPSRTFARTVSSELLGFCC